MAHRWREVATMAGADVEVLVDLLGADLDDLAEEWEEEEFDLTPREALHHMVMGVDDAGDDIARSDDNAHLYISLLDQVGPQPSSVAEQAEPPTRRQLLVDDSA